MRILVTGTGRCGTTWAWKVLRDSGLDVSHQAIRHEHVLGRASLDEALDASQHHVSFEAAPLVPSIDHDEWRVVTLLRRMGPVAESWVRIGGFPCTDEFSEMRDSITANVSSPLDITSPDADPLTAAKLFWFRWNGMILPNSDAVCGMPGTTPSDLLAACGFLGRAAPAAPPCDLNHDPGDERAYA